MEKRKERKKKERKRKFYCKKLAYVIMEADKSKLESKGLRTRITDDVSSSPRSCPEKEKATVPAQRQPCRKLSLPLSCFIQAFNSNVNLGSSLVVQWFRICLPM